MMSRVEGTTATEVRVGMRVRVRFTDPDEHGARIPVFELTPADDAKPRSGPVPGRLASTQGQQLTRHSTGGAL